MASHERNESVVVLGRGGAGIRLAAGGSLVLSLVLFTLTCLNDQSDLRAVLLNVIPWGPVVSFELLVLTSRVEGRGSTLVVVNVVRTVTIPSQSIAAVDRLNGVQVLLLDGRRIGFFGYGRSVIAMFTGNQRGLRLATAIDAWLQAQMSALAPAGETKTRTRAEALFMPAVGAAIAPLIGLLLYQLR